jgi:chromosome segregation ATPase
MNTTGRWLFVFIMLSGLTVYGCAQNDARSSSNARIRALEARNAKLESDYKVVSRSNENYRAKLSAMEKNLADIAEQMQALQAVAQERDELHLQVSQRTSEVGALRGQLTQLQSEVTQRTSERNALKSQLSELGQELQQLAGRIDTALRGGARPVNSAALSH